MTHSLRVKKIRSLAALGSVILSHVAVAGSGQVDGEAASSLVRERYITQLSLVDVAPKTAEMTNEELNHAITGHGFNAEICTYRNNAHTKPDLWNVLDESEKDAIGITHKTCCKTSEGGIRR